MIKTDTKLSLINFIQSKNLIEVLIQWQQTLIRFYKLKQAQFQISQQNKLTLISTNMHKRSMGGRIYQQKTFPPKPISLKNPEQRKLQYPTKGDTSFDPDQFGKKHYLSPRHSAIRSIIFNEQYDALMKQKSQLIQKLGSNHNMNKFDERAQKQKINNLNNYLNDCIIQQNKLNNHSNPFTSNNHFKSQSGLESGQKISRGHLYRQGSMNQVLKPYSLLKEQTNFTSKNSSIFIRHNKSFSDHKESKYSGSFQNSNLVQSKQFPRQYNPNNLYSFI